MVRSFKIALALVLALCSCSRDPVPGEPEDPLLRPETPEEAAYQELPSDGTVLRWDYQSRNLYFNGGPVQSSLEANPRRLGANTTRRCLMMTETAEKYGRAVSDNVVKPFDFTANPPVFRLKVLSPRAGAKVMMTLESDHIYTSSVYVEAVTRNAGIWEDMTFDFGSLTSNRYCRICLTPGAGEVHEGDVWYFDEIRIPDDDLVPVSLFKRVENNPVMAPDPSRPWMNSHIANAAILSPENSRDGNWWMYPRGSGPVGDREHIGVFTQDADSFNPLGPWKHYDGNPVIEIGASDSFDGWRVLDGAPVVGPDGITYVYYKGRRSGGASSIGLAWSEDGFHFTKLDKPWMANAGPTDALYHDGKYYVFRGGEVDILTDPLTREGCTTVKIMSPGGAPSNFDDKVFWGNMVFRLKGVDKWFMAYQGSAYQWDFPDRFHVAVSDDLLTWKKVQNDQPFFSRGSAGQWDQCGIWFPEVIEYKDVLYMYYEGWGREGYIADRDAPYVDGHSSVGVATCPKKDFLRWCGLE